LFFFSALADFPVCPTSTPHFIVRSVLPGERVKRFSLTQLSRARMQQLLGPGGQGPVQLGSVAMKSQWRYCNSLTGCGAWKDDPAFQNLVYSQVNSSKVGPGGPYATMATNPGMQFFLSVSPTAFLLETAWLFYGKLSCPVYWSGIGTSSVSTTASLSGYYPNSPCFGLYVANPSNQSYNATGRLSFSSDTITDSCISFFTKTYVTGGLNNIGTTESLSKNPEKKGSTRWFLVARALIALQGCPKSKRVIARRFGRCRSSSSGGSAECLGLLWRSLASGSGCTRTFRL
jgi:hypothetical protein